MKDISGEYATPIVYFVDDKEVVKFDKKFFLSNKNRGKQMLAPEFLFLQSFYVDKVRVSALAIGSTARNNNGVALLQKSAL